MSSRTTERQRGRQWWSVGLMRGVEMVVLPGARLKFSPPTPTHPSFISVGSSGRHVAPASTASVPMSNPPSRPLFAAKATPRPHPTESLNLQSEESRRQGVEEAEEEAEAEAEEEARGDTDEFKDDGGDNHDVDDGSSSANRRSSRTKRGSYRGEQEEDYDRDPEFGEILSSFIDDPKKARSKMEDRLRRKRNNILHSKTGSAVPMKVTFNEFEFSNSYVWFEFYNVPLEKDISLICNAIRSWHIVGRLGGCNSMNMQLSQGPMDSRPTYDAIQGANVEPGTFYNIGDFEIQDNIARIWVDIGIREPLLLDVLVNALIQINSDYIGIKQVVFGGSEFEGWKDDMTTEDAGYSVHKI